MKRVIILYEGAVEEPLEPLNGNTPLQAARGPQCTALAEAGSAGLLKPVQEGAPWRTEVLLGLLCGMTRDEAVRLRRGPLEAACLDDPLPENATIYRGTFVTVDEGRIRESEVPGLGLEETRALCEAVRSAHAGVEGLRVVALGPGAASVYVSAAGAELPQGLPPRLVRGEAWDDILPGDRQAGGLRSLVVDAMAALNEHAVNEVRVDLGENPATALWLWGGGRTDALAALRARQHPRGLVVTRGRVGRAVAGLTGMACLDHDDPLAEDPDRPVLSVPGLVEALRTRDQVLVHVPAPYEMGWYGGATQKVRALDRLDQHLLAPLKTVLDAYRPYRLALLPDGAVSSETGQPLSLPLPFIVAGEGIEADEGGRWDEATCAGGGLGSMDIERFARSFWNE